MTGWMCPLKREQVRRERESGLRVVNSLETLLLRQGEKVGYEFKVLHQLLASLSA